jgi:hypothetical protein
VPVSKKISRRVFVPVLAPQGTGRARSAQSQAFITSCADT